MRGAKGLIATGVLVIGTLLVASCATSPPKIVQTFWQVNLIRNPADGSAHERLSFFVQVSDVDGVSDLGALYLLNDKSELYWRLDPSNWDYRNEAGEQWVGSNFLEMPDGSPIPRGEYRVLLSNLAGERATGSIFVSADRLDPKKASFPRVSLSPSSIRVASSLTRTSLWLYSPTGKFVGSRAADASAIPLSSLGQAGGRHENLLTVYAYGYDKDCGCGLVEGPYSVAGGDSRRSVR